MSFVDKLKFWKRNDDFALDDSLANDLGKQSQDNLGLGTPNDDLLSKPPGELDTGAIPDLKSDLNPDLKTKDLENMGFEKVTSSTPSAQQQAPVTGQDKDMELISSKLDTIKAELDAMNQRLQKIEKIAEEGSDKKKKFSW